MASIISFIETLIWFIIVKEALNYDNNSILIPISYALGFAVGTYIGMFISNKIINGNLTVNVISNIINNSDIELLKNNGFGVTIITLNRKKAHILIEIDKKREDKLKQLIYKIDKNAFIIINESKLVHNGYFK